MDYAVQSHHSCGQTSHKLISRNSAFQAKPVSFTASAPCDCEGAVHRLWLQWEPSKEDARPLALHLGVLEGCERCACTLRPWKGGTEWEKSGLSEQEMEGGRKGTKEVLFLFLGVHICSQLVCTSLPHEKDRGSENLAGWGWRDLSGTFLISILFPQFAGSAQSLQNLHMSVAFTGPCYLLQNERPISMGPSSPMGL